MARIMQYTEQMESRLPWDGYDNENHHELIEWLNNGGFRTFGDGLLTFLKHRNPALTSDTAIKYIERCCEVTGVAVGDIASSNTLKSWFKGGPRPKKGEDSRSAMFALAFALRLTPEETSELFHKVYLDRAFDYRSEKETIFYFCLQHAKPWADAKRLLRIVSLSDDSQDQTIRTAQLKLDIDELTDENQLLAYIKKRSHNFRKKSISAKEIKAGLLAETARLVELETGLISARAHAVASGKSKAELYKDKPTLAHFANSNANSLNHIYEVIINHSVHEGKGTRTIFKNARLPKEIRNRFPEAGTLSKKDPTYEELRKLIILLASYNLWCQAQENDTLIEDFEFFDTYIDELDNFLSESGLPTMYPGNPYDWLFLYCSLTDRPLDTFRGIIAEVIGRRIVISKSYRC